MRFAFPLLALAAWLGSGFGANSGRVVTILVPGFEVQELPVQFSNINNLRFSPQGKLTALGYDGRIHILHDTDEDGVEDRADAFWDDSTLIVPVGMHWTKEGLYVSSNGKISFFPDQNGDGKADREMVVATNWPSIGTIANGVDATGVTLDQEGNIYFGLLTANYANPYLVQDGVAHYTTNILRGTIQKYSPATKTRETIATGIRVPYTLAFNKHGDLFVTDQEGETWCPNGNPLDELNHVIPGRNYGFPPRHPEHLPNLVSEPPVAAFGPQHQSACGFCFNEPSDRQKLFGPASWEDDAFVAGESRGKIWRVSLEKTPFGYVAKDYLFARLTMLTTDVAISPQGDLYVACHSGLPDWGTGPKGEGKLFKISYRDTAAPLPVAIWPANPTEVRIAFDKPLAESVLTMVTNRTLEFGSHVRAADRLENLKPPYKVVRDQEESPRGKLKLAAARLSEDRRTLILRTDPHPQNATYAIMLPGLVGPGQESAPTAVDLDYTLLGVEAKWVSNEDPQTQWEGWLPHIDSRVNRGLTIGSAEHENLFRLLTQTGTLECRGQLALPDGAERIHLRGTVPFEITIASGTHQSTTDSTNHVLTLEISRAGHSEAQATPFLLKLETGTIATPELHAAYFSEEDPIAGAAPLSAFRLPWSPPVQAPPESLGPAPELAGGDYERGRSLFFGTELKCSTCHSIRGEGAKNGPDLSNLAYRDAASVLRDIQQPNAQIHPDFVAYSLILADGTELAGFVRAEGKNLFRVVDAAGKERVLENSEIDRMDLSSVSLMPAGLLEGRKEGEVRDLLTYLLNAPPQREPKELAAILRAGTVSPSAQNPRDLRVILVANAQDHGRGQHDYPHWQTNLNVFLSQAEAVVVENAWDWPSEKQFASADLIVFYYWNRGWTPAKFDQMDVFLQRGGGMLVFHSSTISDKAPEELARRIGLAAQPVTVKYLHAPMELKFVAPANHPITAGFTELRLLDEPYWPMIGDTNQITVLATTEQEGRSWPMIWTFEKGKGRVFGSIPGHYTWTHEDPLFQLITLRALAWAAREPAGRFISLLEEVPDVKRSSDER